MKIAELVKTYNFDLKTHASTISSAKSSLINFSGAVKSFLLSKTTTLLASTRVIQLKRELMFLAVTGRLSFFFPLPNWSKTKREFPSMANKLKLSSKQNLTGFVMRNSPASIPPNSDINSPRRLNFRIRWLSESRTYKSPWFDVATEVGYLNE